MHIMCTSMHMIYTWCTHAHDVHQCTSFAIRHFTHKIQLLACTIKTHQKDSFFSYMSILRQVQNYNKEKNRKRQRFARDF